MDLGFALPQFDFSVPGERPLRWETVLRWASRAEGLGFSSLWLADHLSWRIDRYGGPDDDYECYDPLVALGALARATTSVGLGTLVLSAPLRPPAILAKALASLDVLSAGRLIIGLGAGNHEPDFSAAGVPFERPGIRLAQLEEAIEILTGLLGGGPFSYQGRHYRTVDARCLPRPVQKPRPPLWVGGSGDRLLDLCARRADGWNASWGVADDVYRERSAALDRACERVGRDPASVTRSLGRYALVGEDEADLVRRYERMQRLSPTGVLDGVSLSEWRVGRLVGTVEEVRDQLEVWRELGVSTLILCAGTVPFSVAGDDDIVLLATACSL